MVLSLNNRYISYESILTQTANALNEEEKHCLKFAHLWLSNQQKFHIPTSGSTGIPKIIEVSRQQMQYSARMTGKALELQKNDHAFVCLSTQHIAGRMMMVRGFELEMSLTIVDPCSNPLENISENTSIDFIALVPLQLQKIINSPQRKLLDKCKAIIVGGAPVNYHLEMQLQDISAPVYSTYGMTETVSHIALKRMNGIEKTNFFNTLPNVIINTDNRGCLTIQSPICNDKTLITNDLVTIQSPNSFEWIGRADNVINSGGVKIQVEKIEKVFESLFYDLDIQNRFIVGGTRDNTLGTKLILLIEGNHNFSLETHKARLANFLSKYEIPKILFTLPSFIETKTGKINRLENLKEVINK